VIESKIHIIVRYLLQRKLDIYLSDISLNWYIYVKG